MTVRQTPCGTARDSRIRRSGGWRRAAAAACLCLSVVAPSQADEALTGRVEAVRRLAQRDPQQALQATQALRREALARGDLPARLMVDEVACRVLSDLDGRQGLAIAQAGVEAAGSAPPPSARIAWLRLRACRAGLLLELAPERGRTEADALAALEGTGAEAIARGLGLLERGVFRSRAGELIAAQRDLIAACALLDGSPHLADRDLCLYHLSSHYRRAGDPDEALSLLRPLHERAHAQGAIYDDSIYVYSIARVLQDQRRWQEALPFFEEALQVYRQLQDHSGVAFAEHGIADCLLKLQRAGEALAHARQAQALVGLEADPREAAKRGITLAEALTANGRVDEAMALLDRVGPVVQNSGNLPLQAGWLGVRAQVAQRQARWKEAFEAMAQAREIEGSLHRQQVSEQSARLRLQFNRDRDAQELSNLRALNEQGQRLRRTQALALALFVLLLGLAVAMVIRKVRLARRLDALASTDELTGLTNRRALLAFARQALQQAGAAREPLAVVMTDVDHFKRINDTHGHAVGDEVLRHLAAVLGASLRAQDRLGRIGGEEFVAVLPQADLAAARAVGERMRAAVEASPAPSATAGPLRFTISLGVAVAAEGESLEALIARADAALYRAKHAGRNRVCADGDAAAAAA